MTVTRGTKHNFLGMDIIFNGDETVTIDMQQYVDNALSESGFLFSAPGVTTPAKHSLFEINSASLRLRRAKNNLPVTAHG